MTATAKITKRSAMREVLEAYPSAQRALFRRSGSHQEIPRVSRSLFGQFFATLNSAVFSDGSFAYIPKGVRCPMELTTYSRINAANTEQFERTLIIAQEGNYVSYLEGGRTGPWSS